MPEIDIDMFDDEPKVGDRVKVVGKVKSIDDDGMVEISYDDVSIVRKKRKKRRDDDDDDFEVVEVMSNSDMSNSQSLDQALAKAFPQTQ